MMTLISSQFHAGFKHYPRKVCLSVLIHDRIGHTNNCSVLASYLMTAKISPPAWNMSDHLRMRKDRFEGYDVEMVRLYVGQNHYSNRYSLLGVDFDKQSALHAIRKMSRLGQ